MKSHIFNQPCFIIFLFFCFLSMNAHAQTPMKNYDSQWKIVETHVNKGLPKSALEQVKLIYQTAKSEKQEAQVIKSVVYMIDLQNENVENSDITGIAELEKEMLASKEPVKSIFAGLIAKKYYDYYQNIRWQLYDRSLTTTFVKEDIATWSTEDFHAKISEMFLKSIQQEAILKRTSLEPYDAIIIKGNARKLRPTLYDLLVHEALTYFSSDEPEIKKAAYAFEINSPAAFAPGSQFVKANFESKDSTSLEFYALKLYQKLIDFHQKDAYPAALIDVDLQRLQYAREKSVHPETDSLYFSALNFIANRYPSEPAVSQASFLIASWHNEKGSQYKAGPDSTFRFEKVKALEICEKISEKYPKTEGGTNAYNLLRAIHAKNLQFSTENVNIPEKPFLALVEYRNINKLYLKLIRATDEIKIDPYRRFDQEYWKLINRAPSIRTWDQTLPETNDFQSHSVEIKIDGLPVGEYLLIASNHADFPVTGSIVGGREIHISNISYVQKHTNFFVLHRATGKPLAGANVRIWGDTYDYTTQKDKLVKGETMTTDANGYFKKPSPSQLRSITNDLFEITHENDRLFLKNPVYTYYNLDIDLEKNDIYLFTDRSIYRPGQLVYYKGIVRNGSKVSTNQETEISIKLLNTNNEEVEKVTKKVNAYGSFSGQFVLPKGILNGRFSISANNKNFIAFSVEEYKRPKFAISFDTLKTTYKVNDSVRIGGIALAYAGNAINSAKVVYRVVRNPRFLYPWLSKRWWMPPSPPMEITNGETTTDQSGKFIVNFSALPDLKVNKKLDPVFDYTTYATITDSNGETREGEMTISVGYKSIVLKTNLSEKMSADSLKALDIRTENMNGEFVSSEVKVKMIRIEPENRLIKKRYWERPDVFVMSKTQFIADFPNDEYNNETEWENWQEKETILDKTQAVSPRSKFDITEQNFSQGFYKIEITTKDNANEEIKDVKFIELTDPSTAKTSRQQYLSIDANRIAKPGTNTSIEIGSSANDLFIISNSNQKSGNSETFTFFQLSDQKKTIDMAVKDSDRGGFGVSYVFVKHNREFQHTAEIDVPWTNKDLKIEYITFRDKTLPGSKEQWKMKISGLEQEKVAAEMLASMYDASLDQFQLHKWEKPNPWPSNPLQGWNHTTNFTFEQAQIRFQETYDYKAYDKRYDHMIGTEVFQRIMLRGGRVARKMMAKGSVVEMAMSAPSQDAVGYGQEVKKDEEVPEETAPGQQTHAKDKNVKNSVRTNFNETAFFLPELHTNKDGEIEFSFTMPEALTRWKFQALAHTKELVLGYSSKEVVTQKDLMVQPNPPRFLRESDKIEFSSKVVNLSDKEISGTITLQLFDTESNEPVDAIFKNTKFDQTFNLAAKESKALKFPLEIPDSYTKMLTWRIVAKAGNQSDGEENVLPVLSNRTLVTETIPLTMRGSGTKDFKFNKLINSGKSKTLKNQSLTIEYTSNPAWYAVQALPYLMEYPYDCAEQTWNRYYANSMAASIVNRSPRIEKVFKAWQNEDTTALMSNLQKNHELKSVLLEETPWVLAAKTEAQQKKNVALLFDMVRMSNELATNFAKLEQMQSPNGGFVWFKGGPDDRYMTQYILTGIGHLKKVNALHKDQEQKINEIIQKALPYLDKKIKQDYDDLIKTKTDLKKYTPGAQAVYYLYMRSFFPEQKIPDVSQKAYNYFKNQTKLEWVSQSKYIQGLTALALHRTGDKETPKAILRSLRETAVVNEELGMYWKTNQRGWWWYEAPIERQALLIEAFQEIENDTKTVDDLKTWLLKNKQTNSWESTKATAEACFALLLQGTEWSAEDATATINLGQTIIKSSDQKQEAGTGYFKQTLPAEKISPEMGNIQVQVNATSKSTLPTWGAVYWQYFENMDKITFAETPLKLSKKLFIEKNSDRGPVLSPINEGDTIHVGDKVKVRIELRADRDMEYVHMKDLRASGLEPVNVLSQYKWQGGLGYYESTKDASTNFFFNRITKGTYVFEYPMFVTHDGDFSNGITTIQCMYAPEFTAHSEGVRIRVVGK